MNGQDGNTAAAMRQELPPVWEEQAEPASATAMPEVESLRGTVEPEAGPPAAEATLEPERAEPAEDRLAGELRELREQLGAADERLGLLQQAVDNAARQIAFVPPQVRMLGGKIEGLATSLSEPRVRALLLGVVGIYDLVEQMLRARPGPSEDPAEALHQRNYQVLRSQLRQLLEVNGLAEIAADGVFDPKLHHAVQRARCDDPAEDGLVREVVRPGFRTEQAVLRYADVVVGYYETGRPPQEE